MNARVSAGARVFSLPRSVRNICAFLCGWFFIFALALGMEAARAGDFELGTAPYGWYSSGQAAADAAWAQSPSPDYCPNNDCTGFYPKFDHTEGTNPIKDIYTGYLMCGGSESIYPRGFSITSYTCPSGTVFQRSTKTCVVPELPPECTDYPEGGKMTFAGQGQAPASVCWGSCTFKLDDDTSTGTCTGTPPAIVCVGQVNAVSGQDSSGQINYGGNYVSTGSYCDQDLAYTTPPSSTAPLCINTKAGQVCTGGDIPKHCATVDGSMTCFSDAGDICDTPECFASGDAVRNSNGTAIAKENAPTPKAPNTGTAGVKAPADGTLQVKQRAGAGATFPGSGPTNNYNTYNSTTVANSYNGDGSIGDRTTQSGDDGECDPATETCGGDGDDDGDCDPQTELCGDGEFNAPTNEYGFGDLDSEVQGARDSLTQKIAEVRGQASQMLGGGLPEGTGSLPVATFEVLGRSFTIDLGVYADKLALVGTLILFGAMALAARIILE
jgi:hypothetical protein